MKNITLEMSLKPFWQTDDPFIEEVCRKLFVQWKPLVRDAETVSVLLWCADGSEILDYRGKAEDAFEWCYHIGGATPREEWNRAADPEKRGLHARSYPYRENPPVMTYGILARIVAALKRVGAEMLPSCAAALWLRQASAMRRKRVKSFGLPTLPRRGRNSRFFFR